MELVISLSISDFFQNTARLGAKGDEGGEGDKKMQGCREIINDKCPIPAQDVPSHTEKDKEILIAL